MLWDAYCLAFFGFLHVSEFTTPNLTGYNPSVHLSLQDVSIDSRENPSVLKVNIKQSKTDPFRRGIQIYLGATNSDICPIFGILSYLARRGSQPGHSSQRIVKASPDNHSVQPWTQFYLKCRLIPAFTSLTVSALEQQPPQPKRTYLMCVYQDARKMAERCLPKIHPHTSKWTRKVLLTACLSLIQYSKAD